MKFIRLKLVFVIFLATFCLSLSVHAQNWKVKITSQVETRTWILTSKAESEMKPLQGATVKLLQGANTVSQSSSNGSGDFTVMVPANGDYIIEVSYPGYNTKRFAVNTTKVPEAIGTNDYDPSFDIGGFILSKPFPGIDYSGLQKALVKVVYDSGIKNFDDEESISHAGLDIVSRISQSEKILINNFCSTNKAGDVALNKPDCPLAKTLYEKAMTILPGENYPVEQLKKVGECLQGEEINKEAAAKAKEEADAKAKALTDKKAADELVAKEKARLEKENKDKVAAEKAASEKSENEKDLMEKEAKKKAAAEKLAAEKLAKQKSAEENKKPEKITQAKPEPKPKPEPVKTIVKSEEPKEKTTGIIATGTPEGSSVAVGSGTVKHKVRTTLGADQYQTNVKKGDEYLRMKRYAEAKTAYQDALKSKANDPYATRKLVEVEKLMGVK